MKITVTTFVLIIVLLLPACQSQTDLASLLGTGWSLSQLNGHSLVPGSHIEIQFERETFSGFGGCNSYGGSYQTSNNHFSIANGIESTAMACLTPEGVGKQETEYFQALSAVDQYSINGNRLELQDAGGELILMFIHEQADPRVNLENLIGSQWMVETVNGSQLIENSQITMNFTGEEMVQGFGGCRSYQAEYIEADQGIRFISVRMMEENCSQPELLQQEQNFTDYFTWADHFERVGDTLILVTQRGEQIVFIPLKDE